MIEAGRKNFLTGARKGSDCLSAELFEWVNILVHNSGKMILLNAKLGNAHCRFCGSTQIRPSRFIRCDWICNQCERKRGWKGKYKVKFRRK